ncbi:MAG: signal peptidase I [Fervidicoccaceae archaeon]
MMAGISASLLILAPNIALLLRNFSGFLISYNLWILSVLPAVGLLHRRGKGILKLSDSLIASTSLLLIYTMMGLAIGFDFKQALSPVFLLSYIPLIAIQDLGAETLRAASISFMKRESMKYAVGTMAGFLYQGSVLSTLSLLQSSYNLPARALDLIIYSALLTTILILSGPISTFLFRFVQDLYWGIFPLTASRASLGPAWYGFDSLILFFFLIYFSSLNCTLRGSRLTLFSSRLKRIVKQLIPISSFLIIAILFLSMISLRLQPFVIVSESMKPQFEVGDIVIVSLSHRSPELGEIVLYRGSNGELIAHRVVAISKEGLVTKGDALPTADPDPVKIEQIIGTVRWKIPWIGWITIILRNGASYIYNVAGSLEGRSIFMLLITSAAILILKKGLNGRGAIRK